MLCRQVQNSILVALLLYTCSIQALPHCAENDEDCHDRRMHTIPISAQDVKESTIRAASTGENEQTFWRNKGRQFVQEKLNFKPNKNSAKNVIMFLGDGMGLTTLTAARNIIGGEAEFLSFEKFSHTGLAKTYTVSHIVPDSAGTATAYLGGVKTNSGVLGVNAKYARGACQPAKDDNKVPSIAKWAQDAGKATGVVTTTRITHASPAGLYANIQDRDWEYDAAVVNACGADSQIEDIAYQLIHGEIGSKLKVMFGGGKQLFVDKNITTTGVRADGRNLISDFQQRSNGNVFVENREQLAQLNVKEANSVLGLFANSHLSYYLDKTAENQEPTLSEMTLKAIEILEQNEEGYFLFVEGGRIDHGHHNNQAKRALSETIEFSKAVEVALQATNASETLIVITADHSHAFSVSGYAKRGNDIFGTTGSLGVDGYLYKTLSYANGPSYKTFVNENTHRRQNPVQIDSDQIMDEFPTTLPLASETHGGEDVPVFAKGPYSHLFTGVYEQHIIPHAMAYAMCIGPGLKSCTK